VELRQKKGHDSQKKAKMDLYGWEQIQVIQITGVSIRKRGEVFTKQKVEKPKKYPGRASFLPSKNKTGGPAGTEKSLGYK